MKYFSLSTVENSFKNSVVKTQIEFWTLLGVLQSIDGELKSGITHKFLMAKTASFLGKTFTLSDNYNEISDSEEWYAKFGSQWTKEISTFVKQGKVANIYELAIWSLRKEEFEDGADINTVLQIFANRFHISLDTLISLFSHDNVTCDFESTLYSDTELKDFIKRTYSQDNDYDNLRPDGKLIVNSADVVQAGAFIKPFFNKLYNNRCLMITTFNVDSVFSGNFTNDINHSDLPLQQIYYGAPGTGKSHKTNEVSSKYPDTVRTTFHPDSDYSTFVGAYKPTMSNPQKRYELDGNHKVFAMQYPEGDSKKGFICETKIEYKFVKQAFLKAYVKAWKLFKESCVDGQELKPQFLVIEEINRGNCAQIFGDLFQLLDRKQNFSEYPIEADADICKALLEEETKDNPSFGAEGLQLTEDQKTYINSVYDGKPVAEKICKGEVLVLPPNLYIWATMNTSDQSLFPIDSAFKRRWEWKYVRINEGRDKETGQPLNFRIQFTTLEGEKVDESWWDFIQKINEKIEVATKSEDKKLGYFFCKPDKKANDTDKENTIISAETFVGKVVFYLWQDVFKDYGFKSDIFKKEGNARLAFHDFYPHNIEPDEEKNPEGIDLKLVKKFIDKVMDRKPTETSTDAPAAAPTTE